MKLSYNWLREFVDVDWSAYELAERITMAGLEVGNVDKLKTYNSMVGKVVKAKDDGKLLLCKVDLGFSTVNVATSDRTIKVGEKLPVVLAGFKVADRIVEKKEFGDFVSDGMFLSAEELGLEESSSEILRLDPDFDIGKPLSEIDEFKDYILDVELTPNRADALSVLGIAREVKALSNCDIKLPCFNFKAIDKNVFDIIDAFVEDYEGCPRYSLAVAEVDVKPSPFFIRMRLLKSGIRTINNVVDITNYVLMEFGQPMHAFDLDKIEGSITVRRSRNGEKILALDGREYNLDESILVIADRRVPIAIAGIMGGELPSVSGSTIRVALESAFFNPVRIRLAARKLKLHTESSHRFERGVDPNLCIDASRYALALLEKYADARVYSGLIDKKMKDFKRKKTVISFEGINKLLGADYSPNDVVNVLIGLNFGIEQIGGGRVEVSIPTYRFDIDGEHDIAEEVARVRGYDTIRSTYPKVEARIKRENKIEFYVRELTKTLADAGLFETINYSFVSEERLKIFGEDEINFVRLENPLVDSQNVMRTTLVISLMDTFIFNINRGARCVPIFEIGKVFFKDDGFAREFVNVGFLLWGIGEFSWHSRGRYYDFYDIKGIAEAVGGVLGVDFEYRSSSKVFLHPKRGADIYLDDSVVGYIGELHPGLYDRFDIKFDKKARVLVGEINLTTVVDTADSELLYKHLPKLPTVWRDLAIVVDRNVRWADIESEIFKNSFVYKVYLFDVYENLGEKDKVSLAFRVVLKRDDRTFRDEEIDSVISSIYDNLKDKFNVKLRGE